MNILAYCPSERKNVGYEITILSVCLCPPPHKLWNQLTDFYEIQ
jgi:hypothetical protein